MSQTKETRKRTPPEIEVRVLAESRRRCALCFHLNGDLREKHGQIAHLDEDRTNYAVDNLAFLCIEHHSLYDSKTSQHKNYTIHETKIARARLYEEIIQGRHAFDSSPRPRSGYSDTTVVSQCARLILIVQKPIPLPVIGREPQVVVDLKNVGPTPADSCTYKTWIEMLPVPFTDFSDGANRSESPAPTPIYPNSPVPNSLTIVRHGGLTQAELQSWQEGQVNLCFRVSLQYTDASKSLRRANFAFEVNPDHLGLLPKYNDAD